MLAKDKFLKKTSKIIVLIIIVFSDNLLAQNINIRLFDYNNSLKNTSSLFIQSSGQSVEEGIIYFGLDRIKIDYIKPKNITIILSEKKGMYVNHDLKETQYFNTNKSYVGFFINFFTKNKISEISKIESSKNFIEIEETLKLNDDFFEIKIIYENEPIKLRKIIIIENNESIEMGFFGHNNITDLDQKFFSMANPYLN